MHYLIKTCLGLSKIVSKINGNKIKGYSWSVLLHMI